MFPWRVRKAERPSARANKHDYTSDAALCALPRCQQLKVKSRAPQRANQHMIMSLRWIWIHPSPTECTYTRAYSVYYAVMISYLYSIDRRLRGSPLTYIHNRDTCINPLLFSPPCTRHRGRQGGRWKNYDVLLYCRVVMI